MAGGQVLRHGGAGARLRTLRACICACVCAVACVPQRARAQDHLPDSLQIRRVTFSGAHAFRPQDLQSAIVTAPSGCKLPFVLKLVCVVGLAQQKEYFDENAMRADVLRLRLFYYQRGYREAAVDVRTTQRVDGIDVAYRISEGPPVIVASAELAGAAAILSPDLVPQLPLKAGEPLNMLAYEATRDSLLVRLNNGGYAHAEVLASYLIPTDSAHLARVKYEALPGTLARMGAIRVEGANNVSYKVVKRMLTFHPGDLYSQDEIAKSQRNLFSLEVFQHVEVLPDLAAQPDSLVPIVVRVNEGYLHRVRLGAGLSTSAAFNAEGRWTSRNFLGGARSLELRMGLANILAPEFDIIPFFETGKGIYGRLSGHAAADFTQPWFFDPLNTLGAGLFAERQSIPNVFVRTAEGGYVSFTRTLGQGTTASVGYRPELTQLDAEGDLIFCVSFVACEATDIQVLREPHWLAPLTATVVRNRTNSLFAPTHGYILRLEGEFAAAFTGSQFGYGRLQGELSHYFEVKQGWVLATRVRPGWAKAVGAAGGQAGLGLHPQKRFFAGGPNSVRGYAQYRLGPKVLSVDAFNLIKPLDQGGAACTPQQVNAGQCDARAFAKASSGSFDVRPVGGSDVIEGNIELRFPLFSDKLRGATFLDFGQVWSTGREATLRSIAWTPGAGLRYFSPIGPIRIDLGYNGNPAEALPVITTELCVLESGSCRAPLPGEVLTDAQLQRGTKLRKLDVPVSWPTRRNLIDRLQLHFSIGQAF